jgi:hypothetical protein
MKRLIIDILNCKTTLFQKEIYVNNFIVESIRKKSLIEIVINHHICKTN